MSSLRLAKLETTLAQLRESERKCCPENGHDRHDREWLRQTIEQYEHEIAWEKKHDET